MMDDLTRKEIRFKNVWSTSETLVLTYLPDHQLKEESKKKNDDEWDGVFRWKEGKEAG